ncbi:hypothetical protein ACQPZ2_24490 [Nocardia pseudovaccinii]|uniref:hypothetical protein n=1 Tax=Nocardia pseudovaccinii TaxID=189540 RepID=UPI003D8FB90D
MNHLFKQNDFPEPEQDWLGRTVRMGAGELARQWAALLAIPRSSGQAITVARRPRLAPLPSMRPILVLDYTPQNILERVCIGYTGLGEKEDQAFLEVVQLTHRVVDEVVAEARHSGLRISAR